MPEKKSAALTLSAENYAKRVSAALGGTANILFAACQAVLTVRQTSCLPFHPVPARLIAIQNDFAKLPGLFHSFVRSGGVGQRENFVHDGLEITVFI